MSMLRTAERVQQTGTGLVSLFVRHPTASNLLMAILILLGVFGITRMNTQFFPTIEIPVISVSVSWPGASAEDVEANILDTMEPELRFLDDVEEVTSVAREGGATISLDFYANADMQKAQSNVEQAIARISTLPDDSEEPRVSRITQYERVASVNISGDMSESAVKSYAKQIRDALLASGIDRVTLSGARSREIWVRMRDADLQRLNLSIQDVSTAIRANTRNLPSGTIDGEIELQIRALSERKTIEEIGLIEIKSLPGGGKVFLRDVAEIQNRFDKGESQAFVGKNHGIRLNVQRSLSADTLKTMNNFKATIAELKKTLPKAVIVDVSDIRGERVQQRLSILVNNGLQGLAIVLIVLFLFLNARIAFWVAAGIPVAFMATLFVMWATGQSINMISMFALIMMLGIIVDDAIVVGEHTATLQQQGYSRIDAAEGGGVRMLMPVMAATLTTLASFSPIFLISGRIGDIMGAIPLVVVAVLIASIIECFFILPGHLSHGFGTPKPPGRFRAGFDRKMDWFRDVPFRWFVKLTFNWRYTTIATTVAALIIAFGLVAGKRVQFRFFPSPEPENITASLVFGAGTPESEQVLAIQQIQDALRRVEKDLLERAARGEDVNARPKRRAGRGANAEPGGASKAVAAARKAAMSGTLTWAVFDSLKPGERRQVMQALPQDKRVAFFQSLTLEQRSVLRERRAARGRGDGKRPVAEAGKKDVPTSSTPKASVSNPSGQISSVPKIGTVQNTDEQGWAVWLKSKLPGAMTPSAKVTDRLVESSFIRLGKSGRATGDNLAQINIQLVSSEDRDVRSRTILRAWKRAVPKIAGLERLAITGRRVGPPGRDLDIQLGNASAAQLKAASEELKAALTGFPGLSAVDDDLPYGKQELVLELSPRGAALGFTGQSIGTQVRNAFEGAIATRFASGDEEITVRVKREQDEQGFLALRNMYLLSPAGIRVPLEEVATLREKRGFSVIQRRDGVRSVSVTADVDGKVTSGPAIIEELKKTVLPALEQKYRLTVSFKGRAKERAESFKDLKTGGYLALALIYIVLAWVFGSYARPLAVMAIIPFGLVGAIVGHMLMGINLTIISLLGMLGLSGILVNDSIILMSAGAERLDRGEKLFDAAVGASMDRFRAVLLTSLTTIGGLTPLLFETSLQAQFLIPMAVTLVFGLAAATILILILLPALMGVGGDIKRLWLLMVGLYFTPKRDDPPSGGSGAQPTPAE